MSHAAVCDELARVTCRPPRDFYYNAIDLLGGPFAEFTVGSATGVREDHELINKAGLKLQVSIFWPNHVAAAANKRPCVVYCHPNTGSRQSAEEALYLLLPLGVAVATMDFTGSGLSDGDWVTMGVRESEDVDVVVAFLRATGRVSTVGLWGRSMGAVAALLSAQRDSTISGLVLDSPFCRLRDMLMDLLQRLAVPLPKGMAPGQLFATVRATVMEQAGFDIDKLVPLDVAPVLAMPAMFGHSARDEVVKMAHTVQLYEAYYGPKDIVTFDGSHYAIRPAFFYSSVAQFLAKSLAVEKYLPAGGPVDQDAAAQAAMLTCQMLEDSLAGLPMDEAFSELQQSAAAPLPPSNALPLPTSAAAAFAAPPNTTPPRPYYHQTSTSSTYTISTQASSAPSVAGPPARRLGPYGVQVTNTTSTKATRGSEVPTGYVAGDRRAELEADFMPGDFSGLRGTSSMASSDVYDYTTSLRPFGSDWDATFPAPDTGNRSPSVGDLPPMKLASLKIPRPDQSLNTFDSTRATTRHTAPSHAPGSAASNASSYQNQPSTQGGSTHGGPHHPYHAGSAHGGSTYHGTQRPPSRPQSSLQHTLENHPMAFADDSIDNDSQDYWQSSRVRAQMAAIRAQQEKMAAKAAKKASGGGGAGGGGKKLFSGLLKKVASGGVTSPSQEKLVGGEGSSGGVQEVYRVKPGPGGKVTIVPDEPGDAAEHWVYHSTATTPKGSVAICESSGQHPSKKYRIRKIKNVTAAASPSGAVTHSASAPSPTPPPSNNSRTIGSLFSNKSTKAAAAATPQDTAAAPAPAPAATPAPAAKPAPAAIDPKTAKWKHHSLSPSPYGSLVCESTGPLLRPTYRWRLLFEDGSTATIPGATTAKLPSMDLVAALHKTGLAICNAPATPSTGSHSSTSGTPSTTAPSTPPSAATQQPKPAAAPAPAPKPAPAGTSGTQASTGLPEPVKVENGVKLYAVPGKPGMHVTEDVLRLYQSLDQGTLNGLLKMHKQKDAVPT